MTLYRKSVHLKDFDIFADCHNFKLTPGMDIHHKLIDKQNKESFYTVVHNNKEEINNLLGQLPILSDRARTLKNIPKARIINTTVERIN